MTKKQRIASLEKHLGDLQDEMKAVKEYIAEIKKEQQILFLMVTYDPNDGPMIRPVLLIN